MLRELFFFALPALLLLTACGQKEFDAHKARELAFRHPTAEEYTEPEIREIEGVLESFIVKNETTVNGILEEKNVVERRKKIVKMIADFKADESIFDAIGNLVLILKSNPHSDKQKFDDFMHRMIEVQYSMEFIKQDI